MLYPEEMLTAYTLAALITKFKSPDMEKPVIRPYTPVSDEGKSMHHSASGTGA